MNLTVTSSRGKSDLKKNLAKDKLSFFLCPLLMFSYLGVVLGLLGQVLRMHQCIRLMKNGANL